MLKKHLLLRHLLLKKKSTKAFFLAIKENSRCRQKYIVVILALSKIFFVIFILARKFLLEQVINSSRFRCFLRLVILSFVAILASRLLLSMF